MAEPFVISSTTGPNPLLPAVLVTDQGELRLNLATSPTAEQIVFLADVRSLAKRVEKHRPWARQEIFLLLENAANAGVVAGDLGKGEIILSKARDVYQRDLQARNRLRYVFGTAVGVLVLMVLAAAAVGLTKLEIGSVLATPQIIISLFAFAGIGSVTSVLTRLSALDLKDETSRAMLILSGASKPLVAISFASVVYIILENKLLNISIGSGETTDAAYLVAAFLCGFSERFASDIIARLEPSADSSNSQKVA